MPNWTSDEYQTLVSFLLLYMVGVLVYSKTQSYGLKQQCLCSNKQSPFIVIQILSLHAYFSCTPLQSDIDKILNWTTVNLMSFNTSKCKQMIISRKKSQNVAPALSLSGQVLELVNHYKYLGFYLSADLSWSYHIQCICTKARKSWASLSMGVQAMWIALLWKDFTHHLWDLILNMVLKYGLHTYKRTLQHLKMYKTLP